MIPIAANDPIADVIALLRPHTVLAGILRATGPWAVRSEAGPHVKIGTVARGECWLSLEGQEPVLLREGDFYLLGNPPRYVMGSSLTVRPRAAKPLWAKATNGAAKIGPASEDDTFICGTQFSFEEANAGLLLEVLPTFVHVPAADPRCKLLCQLGALIIDEIAMQAVGRSLMLDHLAQILLVQMLRAHAERPGKPACWLAALGDERIGAALRAMHANVAHHWTLEELAGVAKMSRSAFASSFKSRVGSAPLEYLIQWRMNLARDALRRDTRTISELAFATGYESESAFSTAFRRVVGASPKQFRDRARLAASEP